MTYKISKKLLNILATILVVTAIVSVYSLTRDPSDINKAELAYLEHSPSGAKGGSVMPASCDSYPWHSTCECNPSTQGGPQTYDNPPTATSCSFANGVGRLVAHCQGGESWTWVKDSCNLLSCNAGYDSVTDYYSNRCEPNCTGNQYRTYGTQVITDPTNCIDGEFIEVGGKTKFVCFEYGVKNISVSSCSACPGSTIPNANHTACVAAATPSVNINIGN